MKAETVNVSLNPTTNGIFSNNATVSGYYKTWTSNATSGVAGLTITTSGNLGMCQQNVNVNGYGNLLGFKTTSTNSAEDITITAPTGYLIKGYGMTARLYSSSTDAYAIIKTTGDSQTYSGNASPVSFSETITPATYLTIQLKDTKGVSNNYLCVTSLTIDLEDTNAGEGIYTVVTLNNTNAYRGALIYYPAGSEKWVWTNGKSGSFSPESENCQWALVNTDTEGEYYLYNLGAKKFISPIPGGTFNAQDPNLTWAFTTAATPIKFVDQGNGTVYIVTAGTMPGVFSNGVYASVSTAYDGPIISYYGNGDGGLPFTKNEVGKTTAKQDEQIAEALARTINPECALADVSSLADGWYAVKNATNTTAAALAGNFIQPFAEEYNYNGVLYPLTAKTPYARPGIDETEYYFRIQKNGNNFYWQMPNGKFLVMNGNKFPVSSSTASDVSITHGTSGFVFSGSGWYAVPWNVNANYFFGETSTAGRASYDIYSIDLSKAGLIAWQMICDNAPETQEITCTRNDVSGLTSVYKNGYIFLPNSVTPTASEFNLDGATNIVVDATNHTVTFTYNPDLAIVEGGVIVEQGWQTVGRNGEVMLLRVTAAPFKNATNVSLTVNLKDGSEANISTLKLYEANSSSPEIYSTGDGAPTKTEVATATISGSTATFTIGNLAAGTHYYWIGATVKGEATLGAIIDAAVTGITYTCNDNVTNLDLTSVGNPSDRGAMVFNTQSYPYLPRDNGSRVYRIPAMVVADDGSIVVACDKRYDSHTDIGAGHVIDIVIRRSTDGGKTWSNPTVIAKGLGSADNDKCGYGDPSLVKGKDGKIYCLFVAGNLGYFYGQKHIAMSTSTDNGVTWSSNESTPPVDLFSTGALKNYNTVGAAGHGLYDYFVTSGRGLYIPEDDILMYLIPAQTMTSATEHTGDSQDYIFYSRDGGTSWYFSESPMVQGGDEAKIIQMNDGSLFGSIRKGGPRRFNTATYSCNDDGKTLSFNFGTQWDNNQLHQDSQNNQDIFYYQRETETGKTDVIIHSITTGAHNNFKLYYSTDQGANWTEFLNVQTKGTRYVTMDKNPANGSLYLFFEDQSLNSAGGYTDYNHYPLNFLEITREQLESLIPTLNNYNVPEYLKSKDVKIVYETSGESTYGSWSGLTWTSNAASGVAGLTMTLSDGPHDRFSSLNSRYNLAYHPAAANTNSTLTLTAPEGYVITGYSVQTGVYQAQTYTLTPENGTSITPANLGSEYTPLTVSGLNTTSTTITITTTDASKWLALANFTITLTKPLALNVVGDKSYATLYVPFNVKTDADTKAYYIAKVADGVATLTELSGGNIPAKTAVVLINDNAATTTTLNIMSNVEPVKEENLLKGTLVPMSLDLGDTTPYYSMGRKDGKIGFYKFNNNGTTTITLGANKAYLDTGSTTSSKGFTFSFGDPSGIDQAGTDVSVQMSDVIYNLSGQRVNRLTKGLYIVNGKKVVIK